MDDRALRCVSFELSDFSLGFFFFLFLGGGFKKNGLYGKRAH